jgi:hypothetical protein
MLAGTNSSIRVASLPDWLYRATDRIERELLDHRKMSHIVHNLLAGFVFYARPPQIHESWQNTFQCSPRQNK